MFNTVIEHLRVNPSLPAKQLRPLLTSALPAHFDISSKFIDNFRRRVFIHIANNQNSSQISYEESQRVIIGKKLTPSELCASSDPMIATNFQNIYKKIMESDTSTWSAIAFLKELKDTMDGFDYRVLYNKKGISIAIMYMTPVMRYNILRYGDVMF